MVQSSTATPTIGHRSNPRDSRRYSDRNVITLARSPVIPKTTNTSAGCGGELACRSGVAMVGSSRSVLVGSHRDAAGALVREPRPGPVDHRLGAVLAGGQEGEVHSTPGQRRRLALEGAPAAGLHNRGAATDRRHRALVVVDERLRVLAGDE